MHGGSVPLRRTGLVVASLGMIALAGCGVGGGDPRAGATTPPSAGACNDMPLIHGDPGLALGSHGASDHHAWGGLHAFQVTVARGAVGPLVVQNHLPSDKMSASVTGPVIAADGDGWHLVEAPH